MDRTPALQPLELTASAAPPAPLDRPAALPRLLRSPFVIVGGITLLGTVLRLYHLGQKPLWLDEAKLYWIAHGSLAQAIDQNAHQNSAPPLYAILINLVERIDSSEIALRAISCLAGIAAIPLIYLLARRFLPRPAASFAALLLAVSSLQVKYAQQLREYSLALLIATLLFLLCCRALREPSWQNLLLLSLTWSLGIVTQYGIALLGAALSLLIFVRFRNQREVLRDWIVCQTFVVLAVALVYELALRYQITAGGFGSATTSDYLAAGYWSGSLRSLVELAVSGSGQLLYFAYGTPLYLFPLFVSLFALGCFVAVRRRAIWLPLLLLVLPAALTFVAACVRLYPYSGSRQDIFLTPMIYVVAGAGYDAATSLIGQRQGELVQRAMLPALLAFVLAGSGIAATLPYLQSNNVENIRPIVARLTASDRPGDRIYVYYGASPAFAYYYHGDRAQLIQGVSSRQNPTAYADQIDAMLAAPGRVWLVFSHCYASECQTIVDAARHERAVQLVSAAPGAWLYLAKATNGR